MRHHAQNSYFMLQIRRSIRDSTRRKGLSNCIGIEERYQLTTSSWISIEISDVHNRVVQRVYEFESDDKGYVWGMVSNESLRTIVKTTGSTAYSKRARARGGVRRVGYEYTICTI